MATQSSNKEVSFLANSGMGNLKTSFLPPLKLLVFFVYLTILMCTFLVLLLEQFAPKILPCIEDIFNFDS